MIAVPCCSSAIGLCQQFGEVCIIDNDPMDNAETLSFLLSQECWSPHRINLGLAVEDSLKTKHSNSLEVETTCLQENMVS